MDTEQFFRTFHRPLVGLLKPNVASEDGEDAAHDIYVRMLEGRFDHYPADDISRVALSAARRRVIDFERRGTRFAPLLERHEPLVLSFEDDLVDRIDVERLLNCTEQQTRDVSEAIMRDDGTRTEIANSFGLNRTDAHRRVRNLSSRREVNREER